MAIPDAEHLYVSCTCESGMRGGLRCADCGGRGIVVKGTQIKGEAVQPDDADDEEDDGLDQLSATDLRAKAKALGLPTSGSREVLIGRIRELSDDADDDDDADEDDADDEEDDGTA